MPVFRWVLIFLFVSVSAQAQSSFTVTKTTIADQKAVFATVEAANVVSARTRIGGTLISFLVQDGDEVTAGQQIAMVTNPVLAQQLKALEADISAAQARLAQANIDFVRAQTLVHSGAISRSIYDQAQTELSVAQSTLKAKIAARDTLTQHINEGAVLAPISGRVLTTPVTEGSVVLPGDSVATIAEKNYVLRLDVPEYHATFLHVGDPVRIDENGHAAFGKITLIYPQITNGRVIADASAPDTGSYFVGARVQVWIYAGSRPGIVIPETFIDTRFGLDYADLKTKTGAIAIPIQRGAPQPTPSLPNGVEILSGLTPGDVLLPPGSAP
ncbi:efflux RND transporter periplasmic adaptor subunit [Acidocella aminolytica]|uniref:RND family efflux transporter HlyD n=1 Tax=Acidocella aminolytica 101 = DSM 11237 TaxID=1120923 RepID=A0A0D6PJ80_9PROT|nr:efflux RND transporter periplasmic adaptor subunit [Acidocella aminolytica]GAN80879.1 RND family efflux transporter HlyD [Acidocella aminolytica 101 = DSM 11237]GBQ34399.1 putative HlyD family secretion efflux protein [Acidocella aminolytica 101 = DSM 11237]SHE31036.1 RND family efflux transporter, MFP subunit [Acidocella aminolytica 101 = DSM 11237]